MKNGFRLFDTHTHIGIARHSTRRYSASDLLRDMDRFGVDRSVVIPFPVVDDARAAHDEIGRAVRAHPDRLVGAACIYPYVGEQEFRGEVRRCAEGYGFRALKYQPQYQGLNILSPISDFLFECALDNGLVLIAHTGAGVPWALPSLFMMPARKFPELRIVLGHAGGGGIYVGEAIVAAAFCPNIFIELSTLMPNHVLEVLKHVAASRLMIGSDVPESLDVEFSKILQLNVSEEQKREILWDTPARVFA
ncbi:MAG TPA: amidohydrolase family protein [Bryobacteraceae bacterium]|nr:amidohydrolase family protein [Bryobacteraceae bacterium]